MAEKTDPPPFRVLSIDGGGIRGIIPAMVLAAIEKGLRPGVRLHQTFDLIVGTSTGAIIAAGLAGPSTTNAKVPATSAADLVEMFVTRGGEIFPPTRTWFEKKFRALRGNFCDATYDAGPLEGILKEYLGGATLGGALTGLVITSYDLEGCAARFFDDRDGDTKNLLLRDLVRASTAAPTFFEPKRLTIPGASPQTLTCVDGGVFAGDPALAAYIEAKKRVARSAEPGRRIEIVSLGTGIKTVSHGWDEAKGWSTLGWLIASAEKPLIAAFMQGQASTSSYQLNNVMNKPGVKVAVPFGSAGSAPSAKTGNMVLGAVPLHALDYIRIDGALGPDTAPGLDVADGTNIGRLEDDAQRILDECAALVTEVVGRL